MPRFLLLRMFIPERRVEIEREMEAENIDQIWRDIFAENQSFWAFICPGGLPLKTIADNIDPITYNDWLEGESVRTTTYDEDNEEMKEYMDIGRQLYPSTSEGIHRLRQDLGYHSQALITYTIVDDSFIMRELYSDPFD